MVVAQAEVKGTRNQICSQPRTLLPFFYPLTGTKESLRNLLKTEPRVALRPQTCYPLEIWKQNSFLTTRQSHIPPSTPSCGDDVWNSLTHFREKCLVSWKSHKILQTMWIFFKGELHFSHKSWSSQGSLPLPKRTKTFSPITLSWTVLCQD